MPLERRAALCASGRKRASVARTCFSWSAAFDNDSSRAGDVHIRSALARDKVMRGRIKIWGVLTTVNRGWWVSLKKEARGEADSFFRPRS